MGPPRYAHRAPGWRRRLSEVLLAVHLAVAPSSVPPWRLDPDTRPVAMLAVGVPTPALAPRGRGSG